MSEMKLIMENWRKLNEGFFSDDYNDLIEELEEALVNLRDTAKEAGGAVGRMDPQSLYKNQRNPSKQVALNFIASSANSYLTVSTLGLKKLKKAILQKYKIGEH